MSILEDLPQTRIQEVELSPEEIKARRALAKLFGGVVGTTVEIMGVQAGMWPFYRSDMVEYLTVPFVPYKRDKHPEIRAFDWAMQVDCHFTREGETHLYDASLWINYHNRLELPGHTIDFLGAIGAQRMLVPADKMIYADPPDTLVRNHNQAVLDPVLYQQLRPVVDMTAF